MQFETYGTTFDTATLPEKSIAWGLKRTIDHALGNEAASSVGTKIKRLIVGKDGDPETVTKDMLGEWRKANSETSDALLKEFRDAWVKDFLEGNVTSRSSGPRLDPEEAEFNHQIELRVSGAIKEHCPSVKVSHVRKNPDEMFAFGNEQRSWNQMVANAKASEVHSTAARSAAKRIVAERARAENQATRASKGDAAQSGF